MHQPIPEPPLASAGDALRGILVAPVGRERRSPWWPLPSRRGFIIGVVGLAAVLALTALALAIGGGSLESPTANALYRPFLVLAPILSGLAWKLRRPDSRFGHLLIAFGVASWLFSWQASDTPLVFTLGVILGDTLALLGTFYLALAFPVGRLQGRADVLVMAMVVVAMASRATWQLASPSVQGGGAISRCREACPSNPLWIQAPEWLVDMATSAETVLLLAATVAVIGIFVVRMTSSPRPRRRALVSVALGSLLYFPVFLVFQASRRLVGLEDGPAFDVLSWTQAATRMFYSIGFVAALIQAELFAAGALRRLLDRLAARPSPEAWRDAISESLDDPELRLGFWDPTLRHYREADGTMLGMVAGTSRAWVSVDRDAIPVAAFSVDEVLRTDPELLRAAGNATLVAVEQGTLEGELRASQQTAMDAGETARRRIAQDLHDSAQQRLVALRIHLELARERMDDVDDRAMLARLGEQVEDALGDIRAVARGTQSDELRRAGLRPALDTTTRHTEMPITITAEGVGRYSPAIEEAVFYSILEALQNAAKHGGRGTTAQIVLADVGGELVFTVEDDGQGFDPRTTTGMGLASMAARIKSVGGLVRVESAPTRGTRVVGLVPTG
jgi:signal transduction histidine kinase